MMDHNDDLGSLVAGGFGGVVRWVRSPDGVKGVIGAVIGGSGCGYLVSAVLHWQRPEVPADVRLGLAFFAGIASGLLIEYALRRVDRVLKKGAPPDGPVADAPVARPADRGVGAGGEPDSDPAVPRPQPPRV